MRRKKCRILDCVLDTFPEHLKTKAKSMCDTLKCKSRISILPSHEIVIDGVVDRGSNIRDYIMDSLIEPPIPETPKFMMLEKENKRLKRNLAYYEKALARARGVSRCRMFESTIDGTVDRWDFSDDTDSDESDEDDDTDGTGEDDDEDDDTDGTGEDDEEDADGTGEDDEEEDHSEEYGKDDKPSKKMKKTRKSNWNFDLQLWKRYELNCVRFVRKDEMFWINVLERIKIVFIFYVKYGATTSP